MKPSELLELAAKVLQEKTIGRAYPVSYHQLPIFARVEIQQEAGTIDDWYHHLKTSGNDYPPSVLRRG